MPSRESFAYEARQWFEDALASYDPTDDEATAIRKEFDARPEGTTCSYWRGRIFELIRIQRMGF